MSKSKPPLRDRDQRNGLDDQRRRNRDRRAGRAERRYQHDAEHEIDRERAAIDQRADPLLADHVEEAFHRPDRGARQQSDGEDEHQVIAGGELRSEQRKDWLAEGEQQHGCRQRRPERPADGLPQEVRESFAVAGRVIGAHAMRGGRGDREVDERRPAPASSPRRSRPRRPPASGTAAASAGRRA